MNHVAVDAHLAETGGDGPTAGMVWIPGGSFLTPSAFAHARKMLKMGESDQQGPVAVVGASPLIKTVYTTLQKMGTGMFLGGTALGVPLLPW